MNGARLYVGSKNSSAFATRASTFLAARLSAAFPAPDLRPTGFATFNDLELARFMPPSPPPAATQPSPALRASQEFLPPPHPPRASSSATNPPPPRRQSSLRARR